MTHEATEPTPLSPMSYRMDSTGPLDTDQKNLLKTYLLRTIKT